MSNYNMQPIVCPVCKTEHKIKVWENLDGGENKKQKENILNGEFFKFKCKKCEYFAPLAYNFLYSDIKKHIALWLLPEATEEDIKSLNMSYVNSKDEKIYISRIVDTPNELKEKIMINDAGMDDRVVELMKMVYMSQLVEITGDEKIKEEGILEMYIDIKDEEYSMVIFFENREPIMFPVKYEVYIKLYQDFIELIEADEEEGFVKVDYLWAKKMFDKKNADLG